MIALHKIAFVFIAMAGLTVARAADTNHAAWKALMEGELAKQQAFLRDMQQQLKKGASLRVRRASDLLRGRQELKPMDINIPLRMRMQCEGSKREPDGLLFHQS